MEIFNKVDFVRAWCYKILPLVYDDSLSYYEVLCKTTSALNDVIENVNNLPEFIADLIEKYITSGAIDEVVREILANYILNVKYPPKGITPAVGDGTADDSAAIQGCIDYAAANGYGAVYFPYGKYLTSPITLKSNVGLYGFDRYSTSIICKGGASAPLFNGNVENVTFANLTLDGNNGFQVNDIDLINSTVKNILLYNLIFMDASKHIVLNGNEGHIQIDNIIFNACVINALTITGTATVQAHEMIFNEVSAVRGTCAIDLATSGGDINFISKASVPVGIIISGNNNVVNASIENSITPYVDSGLHNNIIINGNTIKKYTSGNASHNIGGSLSIEVMQNIIANVTGNNSLILGGNNSLTVEGKSEENISGNKTITALNLVENLIEDKTTNARNVVINTSNNFNRVVTGDCATETNGNYSQEVTGDISKIVAGAETETISNIKTINAHGLVINSDSPIEYKKNEIKVNSYFNGLPISDNDRETFILLPGENEIPLGDVANVKDHGAVGDGVTDDSNAFVEAITTSGIVYVPDGIYSIKNIAITKDLIIYGSGIIQPQPKNGQQMHNCFTSNKKITIRGLTFKPVPGAGSGTQYRTASSIYVEDSELVILDNVKILNYLESYRLLDPSSDWLKWQGMFATLHNCKKVIVTNCDFSQFSNQELFWIHRDDFKTGSIIIKDNVFHDCNAVNGSFIDVIGGFLEFTNNHVYNCVNTGSLFNLNSCFINCFSNTIIESTCDSAIDTSEGVRFKATVVNFYDNHIDITGEYCLDTCCQYLNCNNNILRSNSPVHTLIFNDVTMANNFFYEKSSTRFTFSEINLKNNSLILKGKSARPQRSIISLMQEANATCITEKIVIDGNSILSQILDMYAPIQIQGNYINAIISNNKFNCCGLEGYTANRTIIALRSSFAFTGLLRIFSNDFVNQNNPDVNMYIVTGTNAHINDKVNITLNSGNSASLGTGNTIPTLPAFVNVKSEGNAMMS